MLGKASTYLILAAVSLIRETSYLPSGVEDSGSTFEKVGCDNGAPVISGYIPRKKSNVRDKYIKENMEFLLFLLIHTNNFSLEDQE